MKYAIISMSQNAVSIGGRPWAQHYHNWGHVIPHNPNQGRPRVLASEQVNSLIELVRESPEMFLNELRDWLAIHHDVKISIAGLDLNIRVLG